MIRRIEVVFSLERWKHNGWPETKRNIHDRKIIFLKILWHGILTTNLVFHDWKKDLPRNIARRCWQLFGTQAPRSPGLDPQLPCGKHWRCCSTLILCSWLDCLPVSKISFKSFLIFVAFVTWLHVRKHPARISMRKSSCWKRRQTDDEWVRSGHEPNIFRSWEV